MTKGTMASNDQYSVTFFRLAQSADRKAFDDLLRSDGSIQRYDRIDVQLEELIRTQDPTRKPTKTELQHAVQEIFSRSRSDEYGVWVYYPWSKRLVHLLDEEEFVRVRTDRNRNKITREEQQVLSTRKIGVIGLSVGQSVSLTMALERSFGEIRLADHDTLELSNLNRIRNGVHQMGVNKAVNVAREILEIDPFLKVTCFNEGISKENIGRFMTEGGKLDILVEECDSVDIKILARLKARELGIPVVMDTSDRCMIDVERFDLEPQRPVVHGALSGLDVPNLDEGMTTLEKLPLLSKLVGLDAISERMKASIPEIGRTLLTWPQLAADVVQGGAVVAEIYRMIMLGVNVPSGRWWFDVEKELGREVQQILH